MFWQQRSLGRDIYVIGYARNVGTDSHKASIRFDMDDAENDTLRKQVF